MGKDRVQRLIQVINKIPLFGSLGPSQVQAVLGACTPKRFEEGDVLCAAGTPGDELFILLTGQAGVYADDGTELADISPIATIGEMSIATRQMRTSTVRAKQVSNALQIKRVALDVALKNDAEAQAKILRNIVEILAKRMETDVGRRRKDMIEKLQSQEATAQALLRVDLALGLLARKSGIPLAEARRLLEAELRASDTDRRVLIVDDEDHVRKMLTKLLSNYDVVAVGSGAEAIEAVLESRPDLVITDIRMPDMDGFALLGKLREFHPDLPVLALSGIVNDEDIREYDFAGFLAKPMDMVQFKSVVASALAGAGTS
ncbi:MAG: response regulator [bacterium]|nr:response regulator [bacterium]